jgi:type II secretory pathway component GspD/PulD (secretin)
MTFKPYRISAIAIHFNYLKLLLAGLLILAATAQAASITTIQLHNRSAEEIIPIIKPMLGPGDALTGQGYKLFLRSSPQTLDDVRQIVEALDVASKTLLISVSQGSRSEVEAIDINGSLQVENGNSSIGVGNRTSQGAGSIDYSKGSTSVGVDASSTRSKQQSNPVHRLRVAEGTEGFIQTGAQVPYYSGKTGGSSSGSSTTTTEFKDVTTGFFVLPRIRGDRVTLQVRPFRNTQSKTRPGTIDTQQANTTVSGPLGEWLQIGGVSEQFEHSQTGIASRSSSKGSSEDRIWIKAELIR